jgi:hypothetical protein
LPGAAAASDTAAVESLAATIAMTAQEPQQPTDAELMEILREMFRAIIARGEREHLLRPAVPFGVPSRHAAMGAPQSQAAAGGAPVRAPP